MLWLLIIILSYFLFSLTSLGDRYILIGAPNPKNYSFYVGILSILVLFLIPFVDFNLIPFREMLLCLLAGVSFLFMIFSAFTGLEKYEASTVVPAFGGLLPIFTLVLSSLLSFQLVVLRGWDFLAFLVLIGGSFLITREPKEKLSLGALKISVVIALFSALYFVLAKYVYILLGFWTGFIWMRIGTFIGALFFIFSKEVNKEVLKGQLTFTKKTVSLFLFIQAIGALAFILQNWAVDLAGMVFLPVINALMGVQYLFLFLFSLLLSKKFPQLLKEEISKRGILRKASAILLIIFGLAVLALK